MKGRKCPGFLALLVRPAPQAWHNCDVITFISHISGPHLLYTHELQNLPFEGFLTLPNLTIHV